MPEISGVVSLVVEEIVVNEVGALGFKSILLISKVSFSNLINSIFIRLSFPSGEFVLKSLIVYTPSSSVIK